MRKALAAAVLTVSLTSPAWVPAAHAQTATSTTIVTREEHKEDGKIGLLGLLGLAGLAGLAGLRRPRRDTVYEERLGPPVVEERPRGRGTGYDEPRR